jgi:hypothetical protein
MAASSVHSRVEIVEITERAAVVAGLVGEQPRYFLQHTLGFQIHDVRHAPYHRWHGWRQLAI